MKILALPATLLGFACLCLAFSASAATAVQQQEESPLAKHMGNINRSMRKFGKDVKGGADLSSLVADVCALQMVVLRAKNEAPPRMGEITDEQYHEHRVHFRKELHHLLRALLELEVAVLEEDQAKVADALTKVAAVKKEGHGEFKPKW